MTETTDSFLRREINIGKFKINVFTLISFFIVTTLALLIRFGMFSFISMDYHFFLEPWIKQLHNYGGFAGLAESIGNYTPAYMYFLALFAYIPINPLYLIKLLSVLFDFAVAGAVSYLVYNKYKNSNSSILAYTAVLFAPTVLLNGSLWAQCDIIFSFFLVMCVTFFIKNRPTLATVFFSIALCFKLQAIFLAPLLVYMWSIKKLKFYNIFIIPTVYIISILPAFIAGRSFTELLTIYFSQSEQYPKISMNAPNLYYYIQETEIGVNELSFAAIIFACIFTFILLYVLYSKNIVPNSEIIVSVSLIFAIILPYFLPHMHERYFFTADILSILFAFYNPRYFCVPVFIISASAITYIPYLFGISVPFLMYVAPVLMLIGGVVALKQLFCANFTQKTS